MAKNPIVFASIDYPYGGGRIADELIKMLREKLSEQDIEVHEHEATDIPRALLKGAVFVAENPNLGKYFDFDFFKELLALAKVCDAIRAQIAKAKESSRPTVILCKNFHGSEVHEMMQYHNRHNSSMHFMYLAACCGTDIGNCQPIAPNVSLYLEVDPNTAKEQCQNNLRDLLEKIEGKDAYTKAVNLFKKLNVSHQQPLYLEKFARLGKKGVVINTRKSSTLLFEEALTVIKQHLSTRNHLVIPLNSGGIFSTAS